VGIIELLEDYANGWNECIKRNISNLSQMLVGIETETFSKRKNQVKKKENFFRYSFAFFVLLSPSSKKKRKIRKVFTLTDCIKHPIQYGFLVYVTYLTKWENIFFRFYFFDWAQGRYVSTCSTNIRGENERLKAKVVYVLEVFWLQSSLILFFLWRYKIAVLHTYFFYIISRLR